MVTSIRAELEESKLNREEQDHGIQRREVGRLSAVSLLAAVE